MASKIKVDTIENVAGSGNVSLGSGHNLVVPGNITGQGTAAITSNATVGGTLGVTGASTLTGNLQVGGNTAVSSAPIASMVASGNSLEWGHGNAAGYRSTLGALSGGGQPFIAFSAEHGSNANTFRTRGLKGHAISTYDNVGGLTFLALQTASADNQTPVTTMKIDNVGRVTKPLHPSFSVRSNAGNNGNTWEQGQDIKFQLVDRNNGSHYATGTGRFTAPVAGFYHFNYTGFGYSAGRVPAAGTTSVQIRKNGTAVISGSYVEVNTSTGYPNCGFSFSLLLAASDYVTIRAQSQGQYADASGLYTSFSGFLVG